MSDLFSDLDNLTKQSKGPKNRQCTVDWVLNEVDEESREKLVFLLDQDHISSAAISKVLLSHGFDIQHSNIIRHRRRLKGNVGCKCP